MVVVAAADGTAVHKKPTATGQMRKVNTGWFLVRYEGSVPYGVERSGPNACRYGEMPRPTTGRRQSTVRGAVQMLTFA